MQLHVNFAYMMIDEFLAKYNETIGQKKLDLIALMETHKFTELSDFASIQGRIQGLNIAHKSMRELYDSVYLPKENIVIKNGKVERDEKTGLY